MSIAPKQKIPTSQKNKAWYEDNGKFIRDQAIFWGQDKSDMVELYKAATGEVDPNSYKYVTNPFNSSSENLRSFPARMRNYDIIVSIINLFMGEKAESPFNHTIICTNSDVSTKASEKLEMAYRAALAQGFVNALNDSGTQTGVPSQKVPTWDELKQQSTVNGKDERAILGQRALDYLKYQLSLKDNFLEQIFDWLVVGRVYSYKDVEYNDVIRENVPPLEMWHAHSKTGFVEDAPQAIRRSRYHLNDLIDKFHKDFAEYKTEDNEEPPLDRLENKYRTGESSTSAIIGESARSIDSEKDNSWKNDSTVVSTFQNGMIDVSHAVWKGFKQVGILKYKSEFGTIEELEVDETYKLTPEHGDISIEWEWVNVVHEVYIVDEDIFLRGREHPVQRNEITNTSKCKLPYNGKVGYNERDRINSVVKQLLPYQVLSNIYHYRLELIIAKNKEKIGILPLGLIPDGEGWSEDKAMHIAEAIGWLVIDETKQNAKIALDGLKSIDMSLGKFISEMITLIRSIKEEAWDAIGMNRQRYGDTNSSDGKGVNEQALIRSSVISRNMFRQFERYEESDIQGLIEFSKVAWIDGKKGAYITSDGMQAFLHVDGHQWLNSDMEVFAIDAKEEYANLKMAKDYAFGYAQKGGVPPGAVMDIIGSNNFSKLKDLVNKADQITKQYEADVAAKEAENAQALKQADLQKSQQEGQVKLQAEQIKSDTDIKVALIQTGAKQDADDSSEEVGKLHDNIIDKYRQDEANKNKQGLDAINKIGDQRLKEANLKLGYDKLESSEKIAKMNKNKYDRN